MLTFPVVPAAERDIKHRIFVKSSQYVRAGTHARGERHEIATAMFFANAALIPNGEYISRHTVPGEVEQRVLNGDSEHDIIINFTAGTERGWMLVEVKSGDASSSGSRIRSYIHTVFEYPKDRITGLGLAKEGSVTDDDFFAHAYEIIHALSAHTSERLRSPGSSNNHFTGTYTSRPDWNGGRENPRNYFTRKVFGSPEAPCADATCKSRINDELRDHAGFELRVFGVPPITDEVITKFVRQYSAALERRAGLFHAGQVWWDYDEAPTS